MAAAEGPPAPAPGGPSRQEETRTTHLARPNWEYIRVDVLLPGHPKLAGLPRSARWTLVELWCFAGRYHTDGFISDDVWKETGPAADRRKLVERGLAERTGGGYQMHDFTGYQRSKAEIEALSQRRAEAGRKGGQARAKPEASASANGQANASDLVAGCSDSAEPEAEAEAEALKDQDRPPPPASPSVPPGGRNRPATATRLPADFTVTPEMVAWARANVPHVDGKRETEQFIDHWNAASGAKARKLDWTAAWRTWMRNADNGIGRQPNGNSRQSRTEEVAGIFDDNYRIAAQIEEWEAANDANGNSQVGGVRPRALPAPGD